MNGFVTRLLNVTYGMMPSARPLIAPRFAPGADVPATRPNYAESAVEEQGSEPHMVRRPETGLPAADTQRPQRGGYILYSAGGPPLQVSESLSPTFEQGTSENVEAPRLAPALPSTMPGPRNATPLTRETEEASELRPAGAAPMVNSAEVPEPPAPGVEQSNSSTLALRAKHVPVHHHLSETSEVGQAAPGKFTPHSGDGADYATVIAASRRGASAVSIVSASDQTEGTPPDREGTDRRQNRGRSLASRWMESQREANGRTVEMSGPPVGSQPYPHTKQTVRDQRKSPNVADSPDVAGQPVVRVTIGRIEVRAISQPPPPARPARPAAPRLSLDEYLASQARRGL